MRKTPFRSSRLFSAFLCSGVLAAGCASSSDVPRPGAESDPAPTARASSPIISGTASTAAQDAVVLIGLYSGTQLMGTCTGTLIAPNLVLTARHCVSNTDEGATCTKDGTPISQGVISGDRAAGDLYIYTGVNAIQQVNSRSQAAARGKSIVHDASTNICNADLGFIVLDQSLQGNVATIRLNNPALLDEKLTAVGWGLVNNGQLPDTRQQRPNVVVEAVGPVVLDAQSNIGLGDSEFLVGEAFCSGDSGGPSLSSKGAVVGVVSRGGGGGMSQSNQAANCIGANVINFYTQLVNKQALVMQAFAAAGQTPRLEGDLPGAPVGGTCTANLGCSSQVCKAGVCARRCDDGTKCSSTEVCVVFGDSKICAPAPPTKPTTTPTPTATTDPTPAASAAPAPSTTTTTTSGCSAAPRSSSSQGGLGLGLLVGLAALVVRFRSRRSL